LSYNTDRLLPTPSLQKKKNKESFIHFYNILEVTHIIKAYMRETGPGSF